MRANDDDETGVDAREQDLAKKIADVHKADKLHLLEADEAKHERAASMFDDIKKGVDGALDSASKLAKVGKEFKDLFTGGDKAVNDANVVKAEKAVKELEKVK